MAMNRQHLLAIINSMADDKLLMALSAAGIDLPPEQTIDFGVEEAPGLQPWTQKEVKVAPANKPQLFNKEKFSEAPAPSMAQVPVRPGYLPSEQADMDAGLAAYITPDGMI